MDWWQALLLGVVQGLTEFLPVSSSGHLMIVRELLGVDGEGFLDFTVTVHFATVIATLVVFWKEIWALLKGFFKFRYNDETDYIFKILVSCIPVLIVGVFFKDAVEGLFGDALLPVGFGLCFTAAILLWSDFAGKKKAAPAAEAVEAKAEAKSDAPAAGEVRNGITYWQALLVGIGQAIAVAPGVSRSGTTIATGLVSGVKRSVMAQFSFLMVLIPIVGEQFLDLLKAFLEGGGFGGAVGILPLVLGFVAAFFSGLFACKAMVALVRRARLGWFALYCFIVAILIFIFA